MDDFMTSWGPDGWYDTDRAALLRETAAAHDRQRRRQLLEEEEERQAIASVIEAMERSLG